MDWAVGLVKNAGEFLPFLVLVLWPVIPLWWIPVHGARELMRRIGLSRYPFIFVLWLPIAYLIYDNRGFLLEYRIHFPVTVMLTGISLGLTGIFLQLWALKELTTKVITGVPEILNDPRSRLIVRGPFSHIRHPTYVSHTLMFAGVFLFSGVLATALVALIDFCIVSLIIVPMEEKELLQRFGDEYHSYMARVPRFVPRIRGEV